MAAIVQLAGKTATLTINAVTVRLTRGTVRIESDIGQFMTTGQTADSDSQYWHGVLVGGNKWSVQADGYIDHHATPASRLIGDSIKFRPGTSAAGTFVMLFATGHGFTGVVAVQSIEAAYDAESNRPDTFRVSLVGVDAITYTNA